MIDSNESGHDDAHIMSSVDYIREISWVGKKLED